VGNDFAPSNRNKRSKQSNVRVVLLAGFRSMSDERSSMKDLGLFHSFTGITQSVPFDDDCLALLLKLIPHFPLSSTHHHMAERFLAILGELGKLPC